MRFQFAPAILLPAAASAALLPSSLFCNINSLIIGELKANAAATTYCSSYLSISTQTSTTTVNVTPTPLTATASVTVTEEPVTNIHTVIEQTTVNEVVWETQTDWEIKETTSTVSVSTLTCLDSAFSAETAVNVVEKRDLQNRDVKAVVSILPASWAKAQVSSACSCLSIPTPTTTVTKLKTLAPETVTVTSTATLSPTVDITTTSVQTSTEYVSETTWVTSTITNTVNVIATVVASNGIDYRKYDHSFIANSSSGFTASYFRHKTPAFSGTLKSLAFSTPNWPSGSETLTLSDGKSFASGYAALLLTGFFIAKESGTYTFTTSKDYIDNFGYLWLGANAYDWDNGNTAYKASRTEAGYYGGTKSATFDKGDAVPLAWLWSNGGGVGRSHVQITTPSGSTLQDTTGYLVRACNSDIFT